MCNIGSLKLNYFEKNNTQVFQRPVTNVIKIANGGGGAQIEDNANFGFERTVHVHTQA